MGTFCEIILDLETALSRLNEFSDNISDQMEYAIGHCKIALDRMREQVLSQDFPDRDSEILFFKKVKPSVYSKLLYYGAVFDLETNRIETDKDRQRLYLQKHQDLILAYMTRHQTMVQYYRCNHTYFDDKYFLRKDSEIPLELRNSHQLTDEAFFTWHDHTFSTIMAYEMMIDYIKKELEKLDRTGEIKPTGVILRNQYHWNGSKIELVELVYALYFSRKINHGQVKIKELAESVGQLLSVEITNDIYRFFTEIQQRKIEQTRFLDYLRAILQSKIEDKNE